ncbi:MAG: hypothetical protein RIB58_04595 [Phycisphaerales bacterium]
MSDAADESPKKGLPIKTVAVVLVLLVAEAAALVFVMGMLGQPSGVMADPDLVTEEVAQGDELVEIPVLNEKFTNGSTGRMWIWETELLIQVKQKHQAAVQERLEKRLAEVRTGIAGIISEAQHHSLTEPKRQTITRQCLEYLRRDIFENDPVTGEPMVQGVLIPQCLGFPGDY